MSRIRREKDDPEFSNTNTGRVGARGYSPSLPGGLGGQVGMNFSDDDDDDAFDLGDGDELDSYGGLENTRAPRRVVTNQPFDEALELNEEIPTPEPPRSLSCTPPPPRMPRDSSTHTESHFLRGRGGDDDDDDEEEEEEEEGLRRGLTDGRDAAATKARSSRRESVEENRGPIRPYNPAEYVSLPVAPEVRALFQYIDQYKPVRGDIDTPVKPFLPDFIPAIGDVDYMLTMLLPNGTSDGSALKRFDEPSTKQSDPWVLQLQLRSQSTRVGSGGTTTQIPSVLNACKNRKAINTWISNITELHRNTPPATVTYKRRMPQMDCLMHVFSDGFDEILRQVPLPSSELDMTFPDYVRLVCAILDIPVYDGDLVASLHVLFSLYCECKEREIATIQAENALAMETGAVH